MGLRLIPRLQELLLPRLLLLVLGSAQMALLLQEGSARLVLTGDHQQMVQESHAAAAAAAVTGDVVAGFAVVPKVEVVAVADAGAAQVAKVPPLPQAAAQLAAYSVSSGGYR